MYRTTRLTKPARGRALREDEEAEKDEKAEGLLRPAPLPVLLPMLMREGAEWREWLVE